MVPPRIILQPCRTLPLALHAAAWDGPWGRLWLRGTEEAVTGTAFADPLAMSPRSGLTATASALPAPWQGLDPLTVMVSGTAFQLQVWQALAALPPGTFISYACLARRIGRPRAVRAVAGAVARNPVPVLLPCHRIIRADGETGGYVGGRPRKQQLIRWEMQSTKP